MKNRLLPASLCALLVSQTAFAQATGVFEAWSDEQLTLALRQFNCTKEQQKAIRGVLRERTRQRAIKRASHRRGLE